MTYERMLISPHKNMNIHAVEEEIVSLFELLLSKNFPALGFIYEPAEGLWVISDTEGMTRMHRDIPFMIFKDFNFEYYVNHLEDDDIFWMVDLTGGNVKLMRWYKNRKEF